MKAGTAARHGSFSLRLEAGLRGLIDDAARATGKTRADFVRDAAKRAAEDALLDRTIIEVSPEAHAEFVRRLDAAPNPNERLRRTLTAPVPWARVAWRCPRLNRLVQLMN